MGCVRCFNTKQHVGLLMECVEQRVRKPNTVADEALLAWCICREISPRMHHHDLDILLYIFDDQCFLFNQPFVIILIPTCAISQSPNKTQQPSLTNHLRPRSRVHPTSLTMWYIPTKTMWYQILYFHWDHIDLTFAASIRPNIEQYHI